MDDSFNHLNLRYLEDLYESYRKNPESVDPDWEAQFSALRTAGNGQPARIDADARHDQRTALITSTVQDQLNNLLKHRALGHHAARIDHWDCTIPWTPG
jgi:2-oxoglutarate dehydrogenase complex dehydrogenase (E1) component-like enzyme